MKIILLRSLVIALILGIAITLIGSLLTATYHQTSQAFGESRVLVGMEAIRASIDAFGISGYLKGLIASYSLFFASIFLGCLWQGYWMQRGFPSR